MSMNPYDPCPCGSGKKFKWCCQPFYHEIERAFSAHANGQHETALRMLKQLTETHGGNPEVWGKYAELLWENEREEEAEAALRKALDVNPRYAFGYFLQGMFRHEEDEIRGALLLYRKAADCCDPESRPLLAEIYASIGQCEMLEKNVLAARAAWDIALRLTPDDDYLHERVNRCFGENSLLPACVTQIHHLKPPTEGLSRQRQSEWRQAQAAQQAGKLAEAAALFERIVNDEPQNLSAWYNLALLRAWLGDNHKSLQAFDAYVTLEADEDSAARAWALSEALRFGSGMEDQCDYLEHHALFAIRDPQRFAEVIQGDDRLGNFTRHEQMGMILAELMDRVPPAAHENLALFELPRVLARVIIAGRHFGLSSHDPKALDQARAYVQERMGDALDPPTFKTASTTLNGVGRSFSCIRLPDSVDAEQIARLLESSLEQFFEEAWIQQPRKSLSGVKPIDAAGSPQLRKKLLGVIRFLEEATANDRRFPYSFDRLRHKLGLSGCSGAAPFPPAREIADMNVAELSQLQTQDLNPADLQSAFRAALRLDAGEIAGHFAAALVERPAEPEPSDRYPFHMHLAHLAEEQGQLVEALAHIEAGQRYDCESYQGRRRNDYEFQKARVLLKLDRGGEARDVLQALADRVPSDLEFLGKATEALLSARRHPDAARFAEQGLAKAKLGSDPGRVTYFQELLAAARK